MHILRKRDLHIRQRLQILTRYGWCSRGCSAVQGLRKGELQTRQLRILTRYRWCSRWCSAVQGLRKGELHTRQLQILTRYQW